MQIHKNVRKWQSGIQHGVTGFGKEWKLHLSPGAVSRDISSAFSGKQQRRPLSITIICFVAFIIYGLGLFSFSLNWKDGILLHSSSYAALHVFLIAFSLISCGLIFFMKKIGVYGYVLSQTALVIIQIIFSAYDLWLGFMFIGFTALFLYYFNSMD